MFGLIVSDSRLDDELSVAAIDFSDTPDWLQSLSRDPLGFPKKTTFGTLWKGVDTIIQDEHGRTEFIRAVMDSKTLYAEMLAEFKDTDVNIQDKQGRTALHWACKKNLVVMVQLCLSIPECTVGLRDDDGLTPFDISRRAGNEEICNLFYKSMFALEETNPQAALLRILTVTSEPAVDKPIFPGSAIFDPIEERDDKLVAALVNRGIDLTARNEQGDTALHVAAAKADNVEIATLLLNAGSDVNATGNGGATALHYATRTADKQMVEALLDFKADMTVKDSEERSPLHWAAETGQLDVAELLLLHGAEMETKDRSGRTALQLAEENKRGNLVVLLKEVNKELTVLPQLQTAQDKGVPGVPESHRLQHESSALVPATQEMESPVQSAVTAHLTATGSINTSPEE